MADLLLALRDAERDLMRSDQVRLAQQRVAARIEGRVAMPPRRLAWSWLAAAVLCVVVAGLTWRALVDDAHDPVSATPAPERAPTPSPRPEPTPQRPGGLVPRASAGGGQPAAPDPDDDGKGTLVAIAIGGSCAFAVDGKARGMSSSLRIQVVPGSHLVTCTPPGGQLRSQRVNVLAGKPGIASFRFDSPSD